VRAVPAGVSSEHGGLWVAGGNSGRVVVEWEGCGLRVMVEWEGCGRVGGGGVRGRDSLWLVVVGWWVVGGGEN
jgi:hypothetical protein